MNAVISLCFLVSFLTLARKGVLESECMCWINVFQMFVWFCLIGSLNWVLKIVFKCLNMHDYNCWCTLHVSFMKFWCLIKLWFCLFSWTEWASGWIVRNCDLSLIKELLRLLLSFVWMFCLGRILLLVGVLLWLAQYRTCICWHV